LQNPEALKLMRILSNGPRIINRDTAGATVPQP